MCSAMSNMTETLAKMDIEMHPDLLCIDANERLSSGNCKCVSFLKTGSVILCVTLPMETGYFLLNYFPIINQLRYPKFMKKYSDGTTAWTPVTKKRPNCLFIIYLLLSAVSLIFLPPLIIFLLSAP